MHLDNQALFSDAQDLTGAGTVVSENVLDLGELAEIPYNPQGGAPEQFKRRLGVACTIPLLCQVVEDVTGTLTEMTFEIQQDDDEAFGTAENVIAITIPVAKLVAGYQLPLDKLPREITKRYLRLRYVGDAAIAGGAITSGIVAAVDGGYKG